jgi:hypothetical protein
MSEKQEYDDLRNRLLDYAAAGEGIYREAHGRIAALEAEVERLSNYINDACAILRSPDLTNDGGPGLLGDIKALRHNYLAVVEANGLALLIDKIRQERDELRARLEKVEDWNTCDCVGGCESCGGKPLFPTLDAILNEKEGE